MYSPEQPRLVWKIEGGSLSTRARGTQTKDCLCLRQGIFQFVESLHVTSPLPYLIWPINCNIDILKRVFSSKTSISLLDTDNIDMQ